MTDATRSAHPSAPTRALPDADHGQAAHGSTAVRRYHPLVVALHWLAALLIVANLVTGFFALHPLPNDADKLVPLRIHMTAGLLVLLFLVIRLPTRLLTARPVIPHRSRGLRLLALSNHWGLYVVTLAMISTGFGTAALTGILPLLGGEAVTLPASFEAVPPFAGHELFAFVLAALVALHVSAVVYHRVAHRENILPRMWFGRRRG